MTHFIKSGNTFTLAPSEALDIRDRLPAGTYAVKYNEQKDYYYLEQVENFEINGKIYGDTVKTADRIIRTFYDRAVSTGVMLSGEKGSGKTLLAKLLSALLRKEGIPTILVNEPFYGETFNTFMQNIEQPTVVLFDEFEKVYSNTKAGNQQEQMLTLLDGVYPSKKLFVLTCNDKYRIDSHMKNRPGRIFYRIDYAGLEEHFIREYCQDNLLATTHIDTVVRMGSVFPQFNFDMLKAMVEEMNRYDESPQDVLRLLNAKPEHADKDTYAVDLTVKGKKAKISYGNPWQGNPIGDSMSFYYGTDDDDDDDVNRAHFEFGDLLPSDGTSGVYKFRNADGAELTLTRKAVSSLNWDLMV